MTDYFFRKAENSDRTAITDIFNYFVVNSFAAFPEEKSGPEVFDFLLHVSIEGSFYVISTGQNQVIGFGLMRHHQHAEVFRYSAETAYFILPEHQRSGLGSKILNQLISDARQAEIETLVANISSQNEQSINFHRKNGFIECGRIKNVGKKFGQYFDEILMQKFVLP